MTGNWGALMLLIVIVLALPTILKFIDSLIDKGE